MDKDTKEYRIGPGGKPTAPPKPADCTPAEASICKTTSSFATTVDNGVTKTTATQVKSRCATITGCNVRDIEATTTGKACTLKARAVEVTGLPEVAAASEAPALAKRAEPDWSCEQNGEDGIIWPVSPEGRDQGRIRQLLQDRKGAIGHDYYEVRADALDFTPFYYVYNLGPMAKSWFQSEESVGCRFFSFFFFPITFNTNTYTLV